MAQDGLEDLRESSEDEERNGATITATMLAQKLQTTSFDSIEVELLPGITNEITLAVIIPKLSCRDCDVLCMLNRSWRNARQGHYFYKARLKAQSTETLAVLGYFLPSRESGRDWIQKISLYSIRDESWYELPPIPGLPLRFPPHCQCVSLDGKIYLFGGRWEGTKEVYMLDLTGKREWQQRASMLEARRASSNTGSSSGVIHGKIYVFGVQQGTTFSSESEVYNPEIDTWSRIRPMPSQRSGHQVATVGEEFLVHGGNVNEFQFPLEATLLEAYHPTKDEWRLVEPYNWIYRSEAVFTAQSKCHDITKYGVAGHDLDDDDDENSGTFFQPCSFTGIVPTQNVAFQPLAAIHMDDELLLLSDWKKEVPGFVSRGYLLTGSGRQLLISRFVSRGHLLTGSGRQLLRSRGFGQKDREIVWEAINRPINCRCCQEKCLGLFDTPCFNIRFMCSVQL